MTTFESFQLVQPVADNLRRHGFHTPTPIQAEAIPVVLTGRDVVGLAQTGTGKTAAFVLPILQRLSTGPRRQIRALIVGPTRELAEQIAGVIHELGRGTHVHTALIYGGVGYGKQFEAIRHGAEIVVACPGRLLDHLRQGTIRLDQVEVLVLDEADQMFDMGFLPDIREIIRRVPPRRQTLLFSATMPQAIRKLTHEVLRDPVEIKLAHTAPVETVSHAVFPVKQEDKTAVVIELLRRTDAGPVLIFTRTKHRAKRLDQMLNRAGFRAASIQGNLSQNKRKQAMDGFRSGQHQILVATDVAARGIDVSGISHVINFDMPDTIEAYTHRIGRTGRAAKTGDAFTLVTQEDQDMIRQIERVLRAPIERRFLDGFDPRTAQPPPPPPRPVHAGGHRQPQRPGEKRRHGQQGPHGAKRSFDRRHKPNAPPKGDRGEAPTMTGAPPFQRAEKPKRPPFWQRFVKSGTPPAPTKGSET